MKHKNGSRRQDDFIAPAKKAFRRAARQIRAEHARFGLPLVLGEKGRARFVPVR